MDHQLAAEGDLHLVSRRGAQSRAEHRRRQFAPVEDDLPGRPFPLKSRQRGTGDVFEPRAILLGRRRLLDGRRSTGDVVGSRTGSSDQLLAGVAASGGSAKLGWPRLAVQVETKLELIAVEAIDAEVPVAGFG